MDLSGSFVSFLIVGFATFLLFITQSEGIDELTAPDYSEVPRDLVFTCKDKIPGYYADVQARCQVWHWCLPSGAKYSFLCPNGTVFNQNYRVCDWWFNVDCASAVDRYNVNEDLYRRADGVYI